MRSGHIQRSSGVKRKVKSVGWRQSNSKRTIGPVFAVLVAGLDWSPTLAFARANEESPHRRGPVDGGPDADGAPTGENMIWRTVKAGWE